MGQIIVLLNPHGTNYSIVKSPWDPMGQIIVLLNPHGTNYSIVKSQWDKL